MSARCVSRDTTRVLRMRSASSSSESALTQSTLRRLEQLADLLRLLAIAVRRRVAGVQREAEHADRVGLARPHQRRRHREVLVDARDDRRLRELVAALRLSSARAAAGRPRCARRSRRAGARSRPRRSRRAARCAPPSGASSAAVRTDSRRRRRSAPAASAGRSRAGRSGSTSTCRRRRRACRRSARSGWPCRRCLRAR